MIIAGVTADDAGAGVTAAVVVGREVGAAAAGAGAEDVEPPLDEQAAIAAAATMNSVGRTIRL